MLYVDDHRADGPDVHPRHSCVAATGQRPTAIGKVRPRGYTRTPVMCTELPVSVIDAPRPLSIAMPASLTVMRAPVDVRRVMPPNGPGASEMTTACRPG